MTQPTLDQRTPPAPDGRIVIRYHHRRNWFAHIEGAGGGSGWGQALAALDWRSHAVTDGPRPVFWLDSGEIAELRVECERLGVRVELHTARSTPPAAAVR